MSAPYSAPTESLPSDSTDSSKPPRPVTSATFIQVSIAQSPVPLESEYTEDDDGDAGYETAESVATETIVSSIRDYVYENGRRYHRYSEGSYMLPNDEMEMERLELVHHMNLLLLRGSLCISPVDSTAPIKVLDCGTGTGIWALDFGEIYPKASVVGVDLSPIQPAWVYPNVRFEVDDIEREWTYPENYFDFIYSRHLGLSIRDWKRYLRQMFHHCAPDGRVELIEHSMWVRSEDDTYHDNCNLAKYLALHKQASAAGGIPSVSPSLLREAAEQAGFVDIEVHTVKMPLGAWPKDRDMKNVGGTAAAALTLGGFEAFGLQIMTRHLGLTADEVVQVSQAALKDVVSRKVHAYQEQWYLIGRKPRVEEVGIKVEVFHHEE